MRRHRADRSRGAALAEFGLVAPVMFLILFGIVEFGWAFLQYLDVRHGAREAARLAAVNYGTGTGSTQSGQIIDEACDRMDTADASSITLTLTTTSSGSGSTTLRAVGSEARVRVTQNLETLTGFFDSMLSGVTLDSSIDVRLEQDATWDTRTKACP